MNVFIYGIGGAVATMGVPYFIYKCGIWSVKWELKKQLGELQELKHLSLEPIDTCIAEHNKILKEIEDWEETSIFKLRQK